MDGGFDFKPKQRREPREFEVPPWERDAFEKRDAERQEATRQDRAEQDLNAILPEVGAVQGPQVSATTTATPQESPVADDEVAARVDERQVAAMLANLAIEDKPAGTGFWKVAIASAIVLAGTGLMLLVWGLAATVKSRQTGGLGAAGGMTLTAVGGAFIAIAAYLVIKTLRDRGVL